MPNYFKYTRDETGKMATFQEIDAEICAHFGEEVHPTKFFFQWYDTIGLCHAMGKTHAEILEIFRPDPDETEANRQGLALTMSIANFIHAYFTPSAWYRGR